jgi:hypothetical protein
MQVELLDSEEVERPLELADAIFQYLEIQHHRKRRHGQLG